VFETWGRVVYRWRWAVLALSALLLGASIVGLLHGGSLSSGNSNSNQFEAARASSLIASEQGASQPSGSSFLLIFSSRSAAATDPAFRAEVQAALAPIRNDRRVTSVRTPYDAPNLSAAASFISRDGHEALARVQLQTSGTQAAADYAALRAEVRTTTLTVTGTGQAPLNHAFSTTLEADLQRAETVSLPVALVLLLLIFGSVIAASLPLGVGILTIVAGVAGVLTLARVTDVSQYALNIVTLIGLGLAIDYSLFVVSRYRAELASGAPAEEALATTMATAGRAITFSGITVAVGLSALLFYQGTFLASMGAAGAIVVTAALVYGLTFLPALLAVLGPRVGWLSLPLIGRRTVDGRGFWHTTANWVMRRPVLALVPAAGLLLVLGAPFLHLRLANGDVEQLPQRLEARQGYDNLVARFPGQDQTQFEAVVHYRVGSPSTGPRVADQNALTRRIEQIPGVLRVDRAPAGRDIVVLDAISSQPASSDAARSILHAIRGQHVGEGGELLVTGNTAFDVDVIGLVLGHTPLAVGFVVLATYLVLFLLTGSVVLPLKAVVLNLLSISASFGALVWIFQDGHLSAQLGFTPQSIDPSVPVILFAIVFGMSMDYEVLLVSRIHEEYVRTGDNRRAVAAGLARSGRLITGAAAIMVAVFLAFGLAEVVLIKAIGLGLAIAIAIDATIVRAVIVPAVMRLLGDRNWWAPHPLRWAHARLGLGEVGRSVTPKPAPPREIPVTEV
jgi:RND superfamily putative drug exporter